MDYHIEIYKDWGKEKRGLALKGSLNYCSSLDGFVDKVKYMNIKMHQGGNISRSSFIKPKHTNNVSYISDSMMQDNSTVNSTHMNLAPTYRSNFLDNDTNGILNKIKVHENTAQSIKSDGFVKVQITFKYLDKLFSTIIGEFNIGMPFYSTVDLMIDNIPDQSQEQKTIMKNNIVRDNYLQRLRLKDMIDKKIGEVVMDVPVSLKKEDVEGNIHQSRHRKAERPRLAPFIPVLTKMGYFTEPEYHLICKMNERQLSSLDKFAIYNDYGRIEFIGLSDISYINLDKIVRISQREIEVYPDDQNDDFNQKPKVGEKINRPAYLYYFNVDMKGKEYETFVQRTIKQCESNGSQFIDFHEDSKTLKVKVPHFTKYKLDDDDDDEEDEEIQGQIRIVREPTNLVPTPLISSRNERKFIEDIPETPEKNKKREIIGKKQGYSVLDISQESDQDLLSELLNIPKRSSQIKRSIKRGDSPKVLPSQSSDPVKINENSSPSIKNSQKIDEMMNNLEQDLVFTKDFDFFTYRGNTVDPTEIKEDLRIIELYPDMKNTIDNISMYLDNFKPNRDEYMKDDMADILEEGSFINKEEYEVHPAIKTMIDIVSESTIDIYNYNIEIYSMSFGNILQDQRLATGDFSSLRFLLHLTDQLCSGLSPFWHPLRLVNIIFGLPNVSVIPDRTLKQLDEDIKESLDYLESDPTVLVEKRLRKALLNFLYDYLTDKGVHGSGANMNKKSIGEKKDSRLSILNSNSKPPSIFGETDKSNQHESMIVYNARLLYKIVQAYQGLTKYGYT